MSVPVRYSAAASYAVVDTLQQQLEEEHYQQQQLFAQNSNFANQYNYSANNWSYEQQQQQLEQQQQFEQEQQQQLMQQQTSLTASLILPFATATMSQSNNNNNNKPNSPCKLSIASSSSALRNPMERDMSMLQEENSLTITANNGNDDNAAALGTDWMNLSEEGGYGTPGAAGLEYQKYEQQNNHAPNADHNIKPSLTDNENNNNNNNNNNMTKLENELNALTYDELYNTLKEYDALQEKYHTVLLLPKESRREVTAGGRDGSAYVLRCLKMWYELPSDVLFSAMSLVDRFLDRMAVKPKHMACMSVASLHLAIKQLELKPIPAEDLVTISQCGCTAGDLERMAGVIANKLGVQMGHAPITSVRFLRIYYALFRNLAKDIGGSFFEFYQHFIKLEELENRLENLLCDVKTTVITPSTLALVLICLHLEFHIKESYVKRSPELKHVFEYILFLQQYMNIPDRLFTCGFTIVSGILSHYNGQNKQPYKQRLVWKLSSRTLRVLRPTNRFSSDLPTIEEGISNAMDDGLRSRTESVSSEEEEDWPTSPIIPIFEQCS